MKRLFISTAIIALFAGLCVIHVNHLSRLTEEMIAQIETASISVQKGNWGAAKKAAGSAAEKWEKHAFYLHTTLRHTDIDAILASMKELDAYLDSREDRAESLATAAKLINQLELLLEAEQPSIKNLL